MKTTTGSPKPDTAVVALTRPVANRASAHRIASTPTDGGCRTKSATVAPSTTRLSVASLTVPPGWAAARLGDGVHAPVRTRPADGNSRRCAATGAPLDHPPGDDESADELRRQRSVHRRIRLAGGSAAGSATATGRPDGYSADAARPAGGRRVVRTSRQRRVHPSSVAESRGGRGRSARTLPHFDPDRPGEDGRQPVLGPGSRGQELGALLGYQFVRRRRESCSRSGASSRSTLSSPRPRARSSISAWL